MSYLKITIVFTMALILFLFGCAFFIFDSKYQVKLAGEAFLKEEYLEAATILAKAKEDLPKAEYLLYQAYIHREQGDLEQAEQCLHHALRNVSKEASRTFLVEIYLNLTLNSYLKGASDAMAAHCAQLDALAPEHEISRFFKGLLAYQKEDYPKAASLLHENLCSSSGWMKKAFDRRFSSSWRTIRLAHCAIELEQYLEGRERLEELRDHLIAPLKDEAAFLMALSYAKEALEKPLESALVYYRLCDSYLEHLPPSFDAFSNEREALALQYLHIALDCIEKQRFEEMFAFIRYLEKERIQDKLRVLSENIASQLKKNLNELRWEKCQQLMVALSEGLPNGEMHKELSLCLEDLLKEAIRDRCYSQLPLALELARHFNHTPLQLIENVSSLVVDEIFSAIASDNEKLTHCMSLLQFWQALEPQAAKRYQLAIRVLEKARSTWLASNLEQKGFQLMILASTIPFNSEQPVIRNEIKNTLHFIASFASRDNDVRKLSQVHHAVRYFCFEDFDSFGAEEIANQMADADYFFKTERYTEAEQRAQLVLQIDPDNSAAQRILGLIAYAQENYPRALAFLAPFSKQDVKIAEIVGICHLLNAEQPDSAQEGEQLLRRLSTHTSLSDRACRLLAYRSIGAKNYSDCIQWLKELHQKDGETFALFFCAQAFQQDWEAALTAFHKVVPPYRDLLSLNVLAAQCHLALKQHQAAKQLLTAAHPAAPVLESHIAPEFLKICRDLASPQQPLFLLAQIAHEFEGDNRLALSYLNQCKVPSPSVFALHGEVLLAMHQFEDAAEMLQQALDQVKDPGEKDRLIPLLALAYYDMGCVEDAVIHFDAFFAHQPNSNRERRAYAEALIRVKRWDDALEQYQWLKKQNILTKADSVQHVSCLLNTGEIKAAQMEAQRLLDSSPTPSFAIQLALADALHPFAHSDWCNQFLNRLEGEELSYSDWDQETQCHLLSLYLKREEFKKAYTITQKILPALKQSAEGLLLLAQIENRVGNSEKSELWLQQYAQHYPLRSESLGVHLIAPHHRTNLADSLLTKAQEAHQRYPHLISPKIAYVRALLYKAADGERPDFHFTEAQRVIKETIPYTPYFPEIRALLDKCQQQH